MVKVNGLLGEWTPFFKLAWESLERDEFGALTAFFHGAFSSVMKFTDRDGVSFGKAECEWVDFEKVWKGKFVDMGLVTVTTAKNEDHYIKYDIEATPWGRAIVHEWRNHPIDNDDIGEKL